MLQFVNTYKSAPEWICEVKTNLGHGRFTAPFEAGTLEHYFNAATL